VATIGVIDDPLEGLQCFVFGPGLQQVIAKGHEGGGEGGMVGLGCDEVPEGLDGFLLAAVLPLLVGEEEGGAARGGAVREALHHIPEGGNVVAVAAIHCGCREGFPGRIVLGLLEPGEHDVAGNGDNHGENEEKHQFLILLEELLKLRGSLGDFPEGGVGGRFFSHGQAQGVAWRTRRIKP
jgi:hypothetical protein